MVKIWLWTNQQLVSNRKQCRRRDSAPDIYQLGFSQGIQPSAGQFLAIWRRDWEKIRKFAKSSWKIHQKKVTSTSTSQIMKKKHLKKLQGIQNLVKKSPRKKFFEIHQNKTLRHRMIVIRNHQNKLKRRKAQNAIYVANHFMMHQI